MKKNIFKKLFIKISKIVGYEIIDQNQFYSPTLEKSLDQNLSNKDKSIVLPLGEVKLTKKINKLSVIFRTNSNINIFFINKIIINYISIIIDTKIKYWILKKYISCTKAFRN